MGVLPKGYTLSSLEAFQKEGSLNVQAGTAFVDLEFVEEVCFFSHESLSFIRAKCFLVLHCFIFIYNFVRDFASKFKLSMSGIVASTFNLHDL